MSKVYSGNTKGGSITVLLTSCLTGLDWSVLKIKIKIKIVSNHTANSKLVKQEVNGTVILPPLVFPGLFLHQCRDSNPCPQDYFTIVTEFPGDQMLDPFGKFSARLVIVLPKVVKFLGTP